MKIILPALLLVFPVAALPAEDKKVLHEDLIKAAPLPPGYRIERKELMENERHSGTVLLMRRNNSQSRVTVTIEDRETPTDGQRLAALKTYVNTNNRVLAERGYRLTTETLPNTERIDFSMPTLATFTYKDQESRPLYAEVRIFFTKVPYHNVAISDNMHDFEILCRWSASVEEK